jgi:pimeloyl-ACP methyl ester carboxylesterase
MKRKPETMVGEHPVSAESRTAYCPNGTLRVFMRSDYPKDPQPPAPHEIVSIQQFMHRFILPSIAGCANVASYRARVASACFKIVIVLMTATLATEHVRGATPVPDGFTSKLIKANGQQIHCVVGGSGSAILLVHGYPETWYEWRKLMPVLARTHTVIAVDLRGVGDSSVPATGYDKKTLAVDLHEAMIALGFPHAVVVGHDWGGPVAYAYAAQFRDSVDKLVLIEGPPFGPWTKNVNIFWFFDFFRLPGYAEKILPGREKEFLSYFYKNEQFHRVPGAFDDESIDLYTKAYAKKGHMEASYQLYRTIETDVKDNTEFAKSLLEIPVLAIGAEAGAGEHIAEYTRHVASKVSPLVFSETGHFIPEERPAALAEKIEAFIAGNPVPPVWKP